jgi:hypothetical protein
MRKWLYNITIRRWAHQAHLGLCCTEQGIRISIRRWAPRRYAATGLYAPIPQPLRGFRYFRFNPLRGRKTASLPFFASGFAPQTQGIVDAGLLPARLRRQTASLPFRDPAKQHRFEIFTTDDDFIHYKNYIPLKLYQ